MHNRFVQNVSLVNPSDHKYRSWCREHRERTSDDRPRDPFAQDYCSELMRWEAVIQRVLGIGLPGAIEERILVYQSQHRPGRQTQGYLEIDHVLGSPTAPELFVEIKIRELSEKGKSGWPQLERSLGIARTRWPGVKGVCVNVAIGDVLNIEPNCVFPTVTPQELPVTIQETCQNDGTTIWMRGLDVASFALSETLLTVEQIRQLPALRQAMLNPAGTLKSVDTQSEESRPGLFDQFRRSGW